VNGSRIGGSGLDHFLTSSWHSRFWEVGVFSVLGPLEHVSL
jgi:hypothetical protein